MRWYLDGGDAVQCEIPLKLLWVWRKKRVRRIRRARRVRGVNMMSRVSKLRMGVYVVSRCHFLRAVL